MTIQYIEGGPNEIDSFKIQNNRYNRDYEIHNPYARLKEWIGKQTSSDTHYTLIRTKISDEVNQILRTADPKREYYGMGVLQYFHDHIHEGFGKEHISYPMMDMGHSLDQNILWPYIHIVRGEPTRQIQMFREQVAQLLSDEAMQNYREREKPHNYQIIRLEELYKKRDDITPLEILPDTPVFTGEQMKNIANFLMPLSKKNISDSICD